MVCLWVPEDPLRYTVPRIADFCLRVRPAGLAASAEPLVFVQDEAEQEVSAGDGVDGSAPWYLRVQELAHDSLIAATRAQLAKDAKASNNSNVLGFCNRGIKYLKGMLRNNYTIDLVYVYEYIYSWILLQSTQILL